VITRAFLLCILGGTLIFAQNLRRPLAWWDSPLVNSLDLTDAQTRQIRSTVADYRDKLRDLRAAVNKADNDLESIFNEDPVDQRKANDAIDALVSARGELTRTLSQMDLKLRLVLTPEQWQMLRSQGRGVRPLRRRGPGSKDPVSGADGGSAAKPAR